MTVRDELFVFSGFSFSDESMVFGGLGGGQRDIYKVSFGGNLERAFSRGRCLNSRTQRVEQSKEGKGGMYEAA